MPATPSTMLGLGTTLPEFSLRDVTSDRKVSPADYPHAKALLVMFICNHCPFVLHVKDELARLSRDFENRDDVAILGINANDPTTHPADAPGPMKEMAQSAGWRFPYLFDETQEVAKAFRAACTPDFFLYGPERWLVYRGQLDDSRPNNGVPVTGRDLRAAIGAVLAGEHPSQDQKPSIGCNIKWKAGGEPEYFKA